MKVFLRLLCFLSAFFAFSSFAASLPLEHFASLPDVSHLHLSPDGKKLASVVRVELENVRGSAVQVTRLDTGKQDFVLFTDNEKYIINWLNWKDSRTLLVGTFHPDKRALAMGGREIKFNTRDTRLMIVNTETGDVAAPFSKNFLKKYRILPSVMDAVVSPLPEQPDQLLIAFPNNYSLMDMKAGMAIYQVDFKNQRQKLVHEPMEYVHTWMADRQSQVRLGLYFHPNTGERRILIKDLKTGKWNAYWPHKLFSEDEVTPLGFGADPNRLYISAYHQGLQAIFRVDLTDPALSRQLVYADPKYDVSGYLIYSPATNDVVGVHYSQGNVFFDPEFQRLQAALDKALPNTRNQIISMSDDLQRYLVFSASDTDSGTYYLGQRSPAKLDPVAYRYKNLSPEFMSPVKRYDYAARDGLMIEAYLTLPRESSGKNLPTIIFPHGGPISRDSDAFDYWTQYFANKGYAVLQMNFRGSSDQGLEFRNAGLKNWGKEMQDDIEDGLKKLVADGIADGSRACIVGASYGGYAALMGAVKTPDRYRCAISINGVSNVYDFVRDNRSFRRSYNVVDEQIGRNGRELRDISPVNHADKIRIPVLLVHGDSDRQVDIKHSVQMHEALQKAGKAVSFITLANEDHYLTNNENRIATFRAMDEFLDKYLQVKP